MSTSPLDRAVRPATRGPAQLPRRRDGQRDGSKAYVRERLDRRRVGQPSLSGPARRTLRTNKRFIARRVVPQLHPADVPLPRERAKAPYSAAEIAGFLALADAQPTTERRMRAAGL